jgi:hypothetical protein
MMPSRLGLWVANPTAMWAAGLLAQAIDPGRPASNLERSPPVLEPPNGRSSPLPSPTIAHPSDPLAPDLSRRTSAASSRSSS